MRRGKITWTEEDRVYMNKCMEETKRVRQNYDWNWCLFYSIISVTLACVAVKLVLM